QAWAVTVLDAHTVHTDTSWSARHSGPRRVWTGYRHRVGPWCGCAWPSPCRWARVRADATTSGGHGPETQDDSVAMVPVGFSLSHGFASVVQSLGVLPSHWRPTLCIGGKLLGWMIAGGFMVLPLRAVGIAAG